VDYVKFGKTGLGVSRLCIGCMSCGIPDRGPKSRQPAEPRRGTRNASALRGPGHRRDAVEPAGAGSLDAGLERDRFSPGGEFGKTLDTKFPESDRQIVDQVGAVAAARGVPRAQVALAWLLQKKGVTSPIVGASKPEHLKDAVAALSLKLTTDEAAALERPYVPHGMSASKS
jgi:aryl-alcohol dehydrogenase-like predicted oxidoreductase